MDKSKFEPLKINARHTNFLNVGAFATKWKPSCRSGGRGFSDPWAPMEGGTGVQPSTIVTVRMPSVVVHACNSNTEEAEAGELP